MAAPRIDARLLTALESLDDRTATFAETHRRLGTAAAELGLPRPSYEQTRLWIHDLRTRRDAVDAVDVLLDVAFRVRPPDALGELFEP